MSVVPGVEHRNSTRLGRGLRVAFWITLGLSWVVAVAFMWEAMTTVPTAERLELSRLARIPTPRTFMTAAIFSGIELGIVLAALWPWRSAFYASRLAFTALALVTWFVMTTPMTLNRMDWVHRRWLAFVAAAVLLALIVLLIHRAFRRWSDGKECA